GRGGLPGYAYGSAVTVWARGGAALVTGKVRHQLGEFRVVVVAALVQCGDLRGHVRVVVVDDVVRHERVAHRQPDHVGVVVSRVDQVLPVPVQVFDHIGRGELVLTADVVADDERLH